MKKTLAFCFIIIFGLMFLSCGETFVGEFHYEATGTVAGTRVTIQVSDLFSGKYTYTNTPLPWKSVKFKNSDYETSITAFISAQILEPTEGDVTVKIFQDNKEIRSDYASGEGHTAQAIYTNK